LVMRGGLREALIIITITKTSPSPSSRGGEIIQAHKSYLYLKID